MQTNAAPPTTPPAKRKVGCMAPLLLALALAMGGLGLMSRVIDLIHWQTKPHVTATVNANQSESFGNASQDNQGVVCTRWYQVTGYPEAKQATVSCIQFVPFAPDPGDQVEVAYGGTGSPVMFADIVGFGLAELLVLLLLIGSLLWIIRARRG